MTDARGGEPLPDISVIVPCRNAGRHLERLLRSLVDQEIDEPAEIVLVDNGSRDDSARLAATVAGRIPIRVIDAPSPANASFARNVGVRAARGSRLFFVDADDEVAPGYLRAMAAALHDAAFVTSRVDSETLNPAWVRAAHGPPWQADGIGVFFDFLPGTGSNVGVRRDLYDRIGGFPEAFSGSQDIAFCWQAQLLGARLHFVPDAVYRYRYRDSLGALFRQARNWGRSNVLLYRRFRSAGMPRRGLGATAREWGGALGGLARSRDRASAAPSIVRLGYCVGRALGSLRHRTLFP